MNAFPDVDHHVRTGEGQGWRVGFGGTLTPGEKGEGKDYEYQAFLDPGRHCGDSSLTSKKAIGNPLFYHSMDPLGTGGDGIIEFADNGLQKETAPWMWREPSKPPIKLPRLVD
jgi:hypothetical protein